MTTRTVNKKSFLQIGLFLLIAAVLIYWQYVDLETHQRKTIFETIAKAKWHYIFIALFVGFLSHFFRALRWQLLLKSIQLKAPVSTLTGAVLIGYLANAVVPRLGEIIRCTALNTYSKIPLDKSLGTVIAERLFDTLIFALLLLGIFIFEYDRLASYTTALLQHLSLDTMYVSNFKIIMIVAVAIIISISILFFYRKVVNTQLGRIIRSLLLGLKSIFLVKQKALFLLYTALIWLMYIVMSWLAFLAIDGSQHLLFDAAVAVTAFGSFAMIITPGGIGAYPPIVAGILILYGLEYDLGLAVGWFGWSMQTIVILALGILALIILPLLKNRNNGSKSSTDRT